VHSIALSSHSSIEARKIAGCRVARRFASTNLVNVSKSVTVRNVSAPLRFIVLEDHPLVRSAVMRSLEQTLGNIQTIYEGSSVDEATSAARVHGADCALVDLDLGDGSSPVENVKALVALDIPVMILSASTNPQLVRDSIRAGALAYVSKQSDEETIFDAIRSTLRREPFMSLSLAVALAGQEDPNVPLSEQERTALTLYASGLKMDAVARRMGVARTTAQEYIKRVRSKYVSAGYSVSTKTDLYRVARKRGLLE
jgi:two-component system, NarL family, nitrate/nitrite response regulator NarL